MGPLHEVFHVSDAPKLSRWRFLLFPGKFNNSVLFVRAFKQYGLLRFAGHRAQGDDRKVLRGCVKPTYNIPKKCTLGVGINSPKEYLCNPLSASERGLDALITCNCVKYLIVMTSRFLLDMVASRMSLLVQLHASGGGRSGGGRVEK